jgi:hypothetical protein
MSSDFDLNEYWDDDCNVDNNDNDDDVLLIPAQLFLLCCLQKRQ